MFQDQNQQLMLLQRYWKSKLDPLFSNPFINGRQLSNVSLNNGQTVIPHGLSGPPQGWIITDVNGSAQIFRSAPFDNKNLTLTSNAAVIVSLWVY